MVTGNPITLLILGCHPTEPVDSVPQPLVELSAWEILGDDQDPIGPAPSPCAPTAVHEETGFLEIETDDCPWVTVGQLSGARVGPEHELAILAWHSSLAAAEPATGHMSLWIGDEEIWRIEPAIPGDPEIHEASVQATQEHAAGSWVRLHVHNHGANAWRLGRLERR